MKHKAEDVVRIRSKDWIDAQEKDEHGWIKIAGINFTPGMHDYMGKTAKITGVNGDACKLDIDHGFWNWQERMFDPDYNPADELLPAEDAIRAMLDKGETLYDVGGLEYSYDAEIGGFARRRPVELENLGQVSFFNGLCRRPVKRKRLMTRWEILAWANSEESRGWLVRSRFIGDAGIWKQWELPQFFSYDTCEGMADDGLFEYQRARLLPDLSGIDESTIQGFEIEAEAEG